MIIHKYQDWTQEDIELYNKLNWGEIGDEYDIGFAYLDNAIYKDKDKYSNQVQEYHKFLINDPYTPPYYKPLKTKISGQNYGEPICVGNKHKEYDLYDHYYKIDRDLKMKDTYKTLRELTQNFSETRVAFRCYTDVERTEGLEVLKHYYVYATAWKEINDTYKDSWILYAVNPKKVKFDTITGKEDLKDNSELHFKNDLYFNDELIESDLNENEVKIGESELEADSDIGQNPENNKTGQNLENNKTGQNLENNTTGQNPENNKTGQNLENNTTGQNPKNTTNALTALQTSINKLSSIITNMFSDGATNLNGSYSPNDNQISNNKSTNMITDSMKEINTEFDDEYVISDYEDNIQNLEKETITRSMYQKDSLYKKLMDVPTLNCMASKNITEFDDEYGISDYEDRIQYWQQKEATQPEIIHEKTNQYMGSEIIKENNNIELNITQDEIDDDYGM